MSARAEMQNCPGDLEERGIHDEYSSGDGQLRELPPDKGA